MYNLKDATRRQKQQEVIDKFKDQQKRAEKEAEHKSNETLKDKLQQLKDAFEAGLLDEDEFAAKKEDLLKDF